MQSKHVDKAVSFHDPLKRLKWKKKLVSDSIINDNFFAHSLCQVIYSTSSSRALLLCGSFMLFLSRFVMLLCATVY